LKNWLNQLNMPTKFQYFEYFFIQHNIFVQQKRCFCVLNFFHSNCNKFFNLNKLVKLTKVLRYLLTCTEKSSCRDKIFLRGSKICCSKQGVSNTQPASGSYAAREHQKKWRFERKHWVIFPNKLIFNTQKKLFSCGPEDLFESRTARECLWVWDPCSKLW